MEQVTNAIRQMLSKLIVLWPRESGQGWNLAKFHEQLHILDDIYYNGSPQGSHSGPVEHNHIQMVKQPSQRTRKQCTDLDSQLGKRLNESCLLNSAMSKWHHVSTRSTLIQQHIQYCLEYPKMLQRLHSRLQSRMVQYLHSTNQAHCVSKGLC